MLLLLLLLLSLLLLLILLSLLLLNAIFLRVHITRFMSKFIESGTGKDISGSSSNISDFFKCYHCRVIGTAGFEINFFAQVPAGD